MVNDANMSLWGALGVSSWPTIAVVSPRGRLLAMLSGEGHGQDLQDLVAAALEVYGARGELDDTPLQAALERDKQVGQVSPLRWVCVFIHALVCISVCTLRVSKPVD